MANSSGDSLQRALRISSAWILLIFLVMLVSRLSPIPFESFGVRPRTLTGLPGVLLMPLLHANFPHILANALPLFILLTLLFWDRRYRPWTTLPLIWLASGLGTWLIGRGGQWRGEIVVHIGASGVVFGLVAYLIVAGVLIQSWRSAFIGILVFLFFGGMFLGMIPQAGPVSWEGHLSGAVAGVWAARKCHSRPL